MRHVVCGRDPRASRTSCRTLIEGVIALGGLDVWVWSYQLFALDFQAAPELQADIARAGFTVFERTRYGSRRKGLRIFLLERKPVCI